MAKVDPIVPKKASWMVERARSWGLTLVLMALLWMTLQSLRGGVEVTGLAPDFVAIDVGGARFTLSEYRGKPTVLYFWATWCGACKLTSPTIDRFAQGRPQVNVIGLTNEEPAVVQSYLAETPRSFRIGIAPNALTQAYQVHALPTTVVLDAEGRIVWSRIGVILPGELNWHVP